MRPRREHAVRRKEAPSLFRRARYRTRENPALTKTLSYQRLHTRSDDDVPVYHECDDDLRRRWIHHSDRGHGGAGDVVGLVFVLQRPVRAHDARARRDRHRVRHRHGGAPGGSDGAESGLRQHRGVRLDLYRQLGTGDDAGARLVGRLACSR